MDADEADASARRASRLRTLGARARPLLSTQLSAHAVAKMLATSRTGEPDCTFTQAEASALEGALERLLSRAALAEEQLLGEHVERRAGSRKGKEADGMRPPHPAAASLPPPSPPPLSPDERMAVCALSRALREWPTARLGCPLFVARALLLLPDARAVLLDERLLHVLGARALAPPAPGGAPPAPPAVQLMAMASLANCFALPTVIELLVADEALASTLVDAALRLLKDETSSPGTRLVASAAVYNFTLHARALADVERCTLLLCTLVEELALARAHGELALRLLRALGQLLVHGGPDAHGLALALGLGEHTAELAAADLELAADLRDLLRERREP